LNELALFAGAGGGILGGKLLGWRTICAVEIESYPRSVLLQRQDDEILNPFPIWDDIRTFDGKPWRGKIDIITGGFPCQDISSIKGPQAKGITGPKSKLWKEMARIIFEVQPKFTLVENSPRLTSKGLGIVLGDLAEMGYDARWGVFSSSETGARHIRERIWIFANNRNTNKNPMGKKPYISWKKTKKSIRIMRQRVSTQSRMGRRTDGLDHWMDRLEAIGNGQDPTVVALAWEILSEGLVD
jgi:DNA (cytosine-5)-methyltransferase 1